MRTVMKVALGIILGMTVMIAGCAALFSAGVNEAQDESDRTAITLEQYRSVDSQVTRDQLVERFGEPSSQSEVDQDLGDDARQFIPAGEEDMECVYYNRRGQLASLFQFCFDGNGKYESKSAI